MGARQHKSADGRRHGRCRAVVVYRHTGFRSPLRSYPFNLSFRTSVAVSSAIGCIKTLDVTFPCACFQPMTAWSARHADDAPKLFDVDIAPCSSTNGLPAPQLVVRLKATDGDTVYASTITLRVVGPGRWACSALISVGPDQGCGPGWRAAGTAGQPAGTSW